jgi:hypothetical protein
MIRSAEEGMLSELLEGATVQAHRTVMLSKRGQRSSAKAAKRHPARSGREAKLQICSRSVTLRANSKTSREMPSTLKLNLVRVFERLRGLARSAGDEPQRSLSAPQLICLRFILKRLQRFDMPADPTEQQTLSAIARLGGHLTSNGDPGWLVLGRGLDTFLAAELGYMAAHM